MDLVSQNLLMTSGGKKDPTYIDDVFSTYVYKGNDSSSRIITNGIKLGNANAGSSVDFSDYGSLVVPESADFKFGTGAFTIEFYIYFISSTNYISIFDGRPLNTNGNQTTMNMYGGGQLNWYDLTNNTAVISNSGSTALPTNAWTHVAYVREGTGTNQSKLYFNGSLVGTGTDPQDYAVNQLVRIGGQPWSPGVSKFSISNYRVVKGTAVYTSNFTTPTAPLTDISGTVLLCCQSSTDPFAAAVTPGPITIGTQPQAETPFAQSFGPETATDGEGGLVWTKSRTSTAYHVLQDTDGTTSGKFLQSQSSDAAISSTTTLKTFNNGGYTLGNDAAVNNSAHYYSSWTFRKAPGFFDVVTWTGTGSARTIPHNLGSVPGCIMVKKTSSGNASWAVYHRSLTDATRRLMLNSVSEEANNVNYWNGTDPTSTHFSLGTDPDINGNGSTFVAYLFAGGESTAATARSVAFDGTNDWLDPSTSTDYDLGTGDFTLECWVKYTTSSTLVIADKRPSSGASNFVFYIDNNTVQFYAVSGTAISGPQVYPDQWYHLAIVRSSAETRMYVNGIQYGDPYNDTNNYSSQLMRIGAQHDGAYDFNGSISNFRLVKGTAVYTSSFRPPTKPLTNITNTKLLCCQNSTTTGSTVIPSGSSITANGDPTASSDSPFDDSEGYKFGEGGDQNIIKCGSYIGNGSSSGPDINLGWEPQWFIVKNATSNNTNWLLFDSMRGLTDSDQHWEANIKPNSSDAEWDNEYLSPTSRGFRLTNGGSTWVNENNSKFVYIAIRRPDGYVGKPVEIGSNVFTIATGNSSSIIPSFTSGFPVDMAFYRYRITGTADWLACSRLTGTNYVKANSNTTETSFQYFTWDSNVGWANESTAYATYYSWMWKRHAGFDVVTYKGDGVAGRQIPHSLNKIPEMIWVKTRDSSGNDAGWQVYHSGLGPDDNDPQGWNLQLNTSQAQNWNNYGRWNKTLPTSTHFTLGNYDGVNKNGDDMIAMLFASVEGVSKCGYYDGSNSAQTITTGFQPRFLIIKRIDAGYAWFVLDTTRGWGAGGDSQLELNTNNGAQSHDFGAPTSTGFTLTSFDSYNISGGKFIYYAHA